MAGIRLIDIDVPSIFRFPEWTENVFYPAGSLVGFEFVTDSDSYVDYFIAIQDVPRRTKTPDSDTDYWRQFFAGANAKFDATVVARVRNLESDMRVSLSENDSEDRVVQNVIRILDSEYHFGENSDSDLFALLTHNYLASDSDISKNLDSDVHDLKAYDSDFSVDLDSDLHALRAADSDMKVRLDNLDSDILQTVHDFLLNDSDLWHDVWEADSELRVRITDNDSDIQWLYDRDSDFTSAVDSDVLALRSADSDIRVRLDDHDSDILQVVHDSKNRDSDLSDRITDNDSDIQWLYDRDSDFTAAIDSDIRALKSKDSDLQVQINDNDSDIIQLAHDFRTADSDSLKYKGKVAVALAAPTTLQHGYAFVTESDGMFDVSWNNLGGRLALRDQLVIWDANAGEWIMITGGSGTAVNLDSDFVLRPDSDLRSGRIDFYGWDSEEFNTNYTATDTQTAGREWYLNGDTTARNITALIENSNVGDTVQYSDDGGVTIVSTNTSFWVSLLGDMGTYGLAGGYNNIHFVVRENVVRAKYKSSLNDVDSDMFTLGDGSVYTKLAQTEAPVTQESSNPISPPVVNTGYNYEDVTTWSFNYYLDNGLVLSWDSEKEYYTSAQRDTYINTSLRQINYRIDEVALLTQGGFADADSDLRVIITREYSEADSDIRVEVARVDANVLRFNADTTPTWATTDAEAIIAKNGAIATVTGTTYTNQNVPPAAATSNTVSSWLISGSANTGNIWNAFDDTTAGLFQSFSSASPNNTFIQIERVLSDHDWVPVQINWTQPGTFGGADTDRAWTSVTLVGIKTDDTEETIETFTMAPTAGSTIVLTPSAANFNNGGAGWKGFKFVCGGNNGNATTTTVQEINIVAYRISSARTSPAPSWWIKESGIWTRQFIEADNIILDSEWVMNYANDRDSDLAARLGTTYVQAAVPTPPIYKRDLWVDIDVNRMYRWDSDTSAWIQIVAGT